MGGTSTTNISVAKVVKLQTCASVWANLCFEVGGIVETSNVVLGQSVTAFDFATFYSYFGTATESMFRPELLARRTGSGGVGTIGTSVPLPANLYNFNDIDSGVSGSELLALRAEGIKAVLDKACALRANVYYGKYAQPTQANIITQMQNNYKAKSSYLSNLVTLATNQYNDLNGAYTKGVGSLPPRTGVVPSTTSSLTFQPSTTTTKSTTPGATNPVTNTDIPQPTQNMTYTDYGYRIPAIEANAQNSRAQMNLMDEQFAQFMFAQYLPNLDTMFQNELTALDMDVKRLQVAYFNTILMSPINGVVTGVYKQVGDAVIAGETVIRVEDNTTVNLVGILIYRGMLSLGDNVTVVTSLASSAISATLAGTIIAVRGDESGDDHWAVVISCPNGDSSNPIVPLNYTFDFDDTTVTISSAG
jgi:hypothetical protein